MTLVSLPQHIPYPFGKCRVLLDSCGTQLTGRCSACIHPIMPIFSEPFGPFSHHPPRKFWCIYSAWAVAFSKLPGFNLAIFLASSRIFAKVINSAFQLCSHPFVHHPLYFVQYTHLTFSCMDHPDFGLLWCISPLFPWLALSLSHVLTEVSIHLVNRSKDWGRDLKGFQQGLVRHLTHPRLLCDAWARECSLPPITGWGSSAGSAGLGGAGSSKFSTTSTQTTTSYEPQSPTPFLSDLQAASRPPL